MNAKIIGFLIVGILLFGCEKDGININSLSNSEGLSMWWGHQIFGDKGRGFIFELYEAQRKENFYELVFDYNIDKRRKNIDIYLVDKIDEGICPWFPSPNKTDNLCTSNGDFFIPEDLISGGNYTFTVHTSDFKIRSSILIEKDKIILNIPENDHFSCSVKEVFPTPKNLLYGSIIFTGEENTEFANEFFTKLAAIGLHEMVVSNPPFNLTVDENGKPGDRHWPPDQHSLSFLYSLDKSFQAVVALAKENFNKYNLNIYLFTSNGDQARFNTIDGILVKYAS